MNYTIKLVPNVNWSDVDGQTVLFSNSTGDFYGMNPTATYLVKELLQSDFEATKQKAAQSFGVEAEMVGTDLKEVVDSLVGAKLVAVVPVSAPV